MSKNITQEMIDKARREWSRERVSAKIIPTPTRSYKVGDMCRIGNLEDCVVAEVLEDGKAYRVDYVTVDNNYGREKIRTPMTRCWWWFNVDAKSQNDETPEMFVDWLPGQIQNSDVSSLIYLMSSSGLVCDPRYQRDYVWDEENQENLIDSIFNRINIGSFLFSRQRGYMHDNSTETVTYINLDGDEVELNKAEDNTVAVIDGQQRLTTLWRFYTNQFQYRGVYFKDLHFSDQHNFLNMMLSYRIFEEGDVSYEDVLCMFIRVNRGVPQDASHLESVINKLENLK